MAERYSAGGPSTGERESELLSMINVWLARATAKGAHPARGLMNTSAIGVLHEANCHFSSAAAHHGNHVSPNPGLPSAHCYLMEQSRGRILPGRLAKRENKVNTRHQPPKTQIAEDGLHYTTKTAGSAYSRPAQSAVTGTTMSCFRCGRHKPLSELVSKRILGRNGKVCAVNCRSQP
jgi:hypothetical protein